MPPSILVKKIIFKAQSSLRSKLNFVEGLSPSVAARAWGVWNNPLGEFRGWKITFLSSEKVEAVFRAMSLLDLIQVGEWTIKTLWMKQGDWMSQKKSKLVGLQYELLAQDIFEKDQQKIFVRVKDVERQKPNESEFDVQVQYFDKDEHLLARAQYHFEFLRSEENGINKRVLGM